MRKHILLTVDFVAEIPEGVNPNEIALQIDYSGMQMISLNGNPIEGKITQHTTREGVFEDSDLEIG